MHKQEARASRGGFFAALGLLLARVGVLVCLRQSVQYIIVPHPRRRQRCPRKSYFERECNHECVCI